MTSPAAPDPAGAAAPAGEGRGLPLPAARESTDYLAGFSAGYRAACAAHGALDDAVAALAEQKPWQALEVQTARQAATATHGTEKTTAQLRADAFASWGLTDQQALTPTSAPSDSEEIGL